MEIKTKKIITLSKSDNPFHTSSYYKKTKNVYDQLMNCICWHGYYIHRLCEGRCDMPYCTCEKFVYGEVDIWDFKREENNEQVRKYEGGLF